MTREIGHQAQVTHHLGVAGKRCFSRAQSGHGPRGLDTRVQGRAGVGWAPVSSAPTGPMPQAARSDPCPVHELPQPTCSPPFPLQEAGGVSSGSPQGLLPVPAGPHGDRAPGQDKDTCPGHHRVRSGGQPHDGASNPSRSHSHPGLGRYSGTSPAWSSLHVAPIPEASEDVLSLLPGSQVLSSVMPLQLGACPAGSRPAAGSLLPAPLHSHVPSV